MKHQNKIFSLGNNLAPGLQNYLLGCFGVTGVYLMGNLWLFDSIVRLVKGAANPFFAVLIIVTTLLGQLLTLFHAVKLIREAGLVHGINNAIGLRKGEAQEHQQKEIERVLGSHSDGLASWHLFNNFIADHSRQQAYDKSSLRIKLQAFDDAVGRRVILPQYIANTLIGLGLFGTFLGLIVTLKEVAALIGVFAVSGNMDSSDMMGQFFQKMSGPLAGMGEAFVASLLGLGGSIINNVQLLVFKNLQKQITYQTDLSFIQAVESAYGTSYQDENGLPVAQDMRIAEMQLKEMSVLRVGMHKQTDAILMAASRMRQVSEAMDQFLAYLHSVNQQNDIRSRIERAAVFVEQRLDVLVHKFEENQQAQQSLLSISRGMNDSMRELNDKVAQMAQGLGNALGEVVTLRDVLANEGVTGRHELRQHIFEFKQVVRQELQEIASNVSEGSRHQREQSAVLSDICTHVHATVEGVQTLTKCTQRATERLSPQFAELIARLEKNDNALQTVITHDLSELQHKLDMLQLGERANS